MSPEQRTMLFSLLNQAARKMHRTADKELRYELTEVALGKLKSCTKFNQGDVDLMKAHLLLIIDRDNLTARIAVDNPGIKECERLVKGIEQFLPNGLYSAFYEPYVEKISENKFGTRYWRTLPVEKMCELHLTVRNRARRFNGGDLKYKPYAERVKAAEAKE
jgi:hypothetical protein